MPTKILEIGYGRSSSSAVKSNGEIFRDSKTHYFGMDLPQGTNRVNRDDLQTIRPVEAHWAALPYRNSAFGAVIMRSCFGQYKDRPQNWRSPIASAEYALYEAIRVLEPGGELFISEENTPEDLYMLLPGILRAGFDIIAVEQETKTSNPNPEYAKLRQKYYGDSIRGIRGGGYFNDRYVISSIKPKDFTFVTVRVNARPLLCHRGEPMQQWRGEKLNVELDYHLPSDTGTLGSKFGIESRMAELLGDY